MTSQESSTAVPVFQPLPTHGKFKNRTGQVFGRLTILGFAGQASGHGRWWCRCECGNYANVSGTHMVSGFSKSCGCWNLERLKQRRKHRALGMMETPEYVAYHNAKRRCQSKTCMDYPGYGGRGILFKFENFDQFLDHVGKRPSPKHSLDRRAVNGHYEIGNVRWATQTEQMNNTRSNLWITIDGERRTATQWATSPQHAKVIRRRVKRGWCPACAVLAPVAGSSGERRRPVCSHTPVND